MISFDVSKEDRDKIQRTVDRFINLIDVEDVQSLEMDITATHANGCPLDLDKLLRADEFNFLHDVTGIRNCLNRETGELGVFLPRCAK